MKMTGSGALTELLKSVFFIQLASEFWELLNWSFLCMYRYKPKYSYFLKMLGKWATIGLENSGLCSSVIFQIMLGKVISRVPRSWRLLLASSPQKLHPEAYSLRLDDDYYNLHLGVRRDSQVRKVLAELKHENLLSLESKNPREKKNELGRICWYLRAGRVETTGHLEFSGQPFQPAGELKVQ